MSNATNEYVVPTINMNETDVIAYVQGINNNQAVIEFNLDGTILSANELFLETVGYSAKEIIGKHHSIFCTPQLSSCAEYKQFWEDLRHGIAQRGEYFRIAKHKKPIWLYAVYTPVYDKNNKLVKVIKFASNITAQKQLAIEFESKLGAISRSQAVVEFDLEGRLLYANDNFKRLMGYNESEILGQHHRLFVPQDIADSVAYEEFWKKLGRGEFDRGEYLRIAKGGRHVWISATYNPILDVDGKPFKIIKFANDVTQEKVAAIENKTRVDAISHDHCLFELSRKDEVLSINKTAEQVLGIQEKEIIGKKHDTLMFDGDDKDPKYLELWKQLYNGKSTSLLTRRKGHKDREVWLHSTYSPIIGFEGSLEKVIVIAQDITERTLQILDYEGKMRAVDRSSAMIEFNLEGQVLTANENFLTLMGYDIKEILGVHHRVFVCPEYAGSAEYDNFWDRLRRGEYVSGQFQRIGKDGKDVWIEATYSPIFNPLGEVIKIVKFATDITSQKIQDSEFIAKVDALDKGFAVIEFDLSGKVLTANRNFLAAMGYTLREIQHQHHSMFCNEDYVKSDEYRDFWLRLNEGEFVSGRFHRLGKYERDVWIQATYSPIYDLNGKVMKIVKYAYDVTREVMLEGLISSKCQDMSDRLSKLSSSVNAIADNVDSADLLAKESASAATKGRESIARSMEAIERITDSSKKVSNIVEVITDIASQTNLLAFNAAIEAARAGHQGVGFSVVAAEVRKLAERSSTAAMEITQLIGESQANVREGSVVSKEAANSFDGITKNVNLTEGRVGEIAKATREQMAVADEVDQLINDLVSLVRKP
jgi:methyl-accepting chemotaxis protein